MAIEYAVIGLAVAALGGIASGVLAAFRKASTRTIIAIGAVYSTVGVLFFNLNGALKMASLGVALFLVSFVCVMSGVWTFTIIQRFR